MMKKMLLLALLHVMISSSVCGQDKDAMGRHQRVLKTLFTRVEGAATDNERYLASEEAMQQLLAALDEESSQRWRWELGDYVSVLTSGDGKLRVFSWAVVRDDGEFECFGVMQYYDEREEEYRHTVLTDKSDEIVNREETVLDASHWLGAVYQSLIETRAGDRTYYTLLGWNGVDNLTERKIVEPVTLRGGRVQFGAPIFRRERNLRRIVLEYSNEAVVNLSYGDRVIQTVERKREKVRGTKRHRTVEKVKERKERVILYDEVEAQVAGMEGLFEWYYPSGTEVAWQWVDSKWQRVEGAQGRGPKL